MLEYLFFDPELRDRFVAFAESQGVACTPGEDDSTVLLPEDIADEVAEAIEETYDRLLQENAERLEEGEDALEKNVAAVMVQLSDGRPCNIKLDPELLSRLLQSISVEELRDLVQSIAVAVENPSDKPVCQL